MSYSTRAFVPTIAGLAIALVIIFAASAGWSQDEEASYMDSYTGADAEMVGSTVCLACHTNRGAGEDEATHVSIFDGDEENAFFGNGCEACHGPGGNHNGVAAGILDFMKMEVADVTGRCTMCHEELGTFKLEDWQDGRHLGASISCVACHTGHSAVESFLTAETDVDVCSTCHVDICEAFEAGEHGAPGTDMTCADCHNPHD